MNVKCCCLAVFVMLALLSGCQCSDGGISVEDLKVDIRPDVFSVPCPDSSKYADLSVYLKNRTEKTLFVTGVSSVSPSLSIKPLKVFHLWPDEWKLLRLKLTLKSTKTRIEKIRFTFSNASQNGVLHHVYREVSIGLRNIPPLPSLSCQEASTGWKASWLFLQSLDVKCGIDKPSSFWNLKGIKWVPALDNNGSMNVTKEGWKWSANWPVVGKNGQLVPLVKGHIRYDFDGMCGERKSRRIPVELTQKTTTIHYKLLEAPCESDWECQQKHPDSKCEAHPSFLNRRCVRTKNLERWIYPQLQPGQTSDKYLLLTVTGREPVSLDSKLTGLDASSFLSYNRTTFVDAGDSLLLKVRYRPLTTKATSATLTVTTTQYPNSTLKISLQRAMSGCSLKKNRSGNEILTYPLETTPVTITNQGSKTCLVQALSLEKKDNNFRLLRVPSTQFSIAPGQSFSFQIRSEQASGPWSFNELLLLSNDIAGSRKRGNSRL